MSDQTETVEQPSTETVTTEWFVHIMGMDDVLDALGREDAHRRAHKVNTDLLAFEAVRERSESDIYRPMVWAVPLHGAPRAVIPAHVEAEWEEWGRNG